VVHPNRPSGRGGARKGAGRKKKGEGKPVGMTGVDLKALLEAPIPEEIDGIAQQHAHTAITSLVKLLIYGTSDTAKIQAASEILDRGYGKPAVEIGGDAAMLPFMRAPDSSVSLTSTVRSEARKYANLAIEVLRKVADGAQSETSRASASKALLARGLGTVATAKMPDELREKTLGKKEMAQRAAEAAATGRLATPPPPPRQNERVQ
jgi:hypothetical protein